MKLLETTYIRIGNEEYAEENGSFGLTTLRNQHVQILGDVLKFHFRGKSGLHHEITVQDRRLARVLRRCKDIPGSALFEYLDENSQPQTLDYTYTEAYPAGTAELECGMPGHYDMGQHMDITVV